MRTRLVAVLGTVLSLASVSTAVAEGPTAVGTDSDGVSYVGYASGGTIERFAGASGEQLPSWGTPGTGAGQLGQILAIDVASSPGNVNGGNVWILDSNRRVQEFTRTGTYIRGFQLSSCYLTPAAGRNGGLDVTDDSIYVGHPCRPEILRFSRSTLAQQALAPVVGYPSGVAAQPFPGTAPASTRALFVSFPDAKKVEGRDLLNLDFKNNGPGLPNLDYEPRDVYVDAAGVLFVSDITYDIVRQYDSNFSQFRFVGGTGSAAGQFNDPVAFDVFPQYSDYAGNLFVADRGNERIQRLNPFGFTFWAATADGPGGGSPAAPVNTGAPSISGGTAVGQTVTCNTGAWTGASSYTYAWLRNGSQIATGQTYTLVAADVGTSITCRVTATGPGGTASATSAAIAPTPVSGGPRVGVTINTAAEFANSRSVTLRITPPAGATSVVISNDGGFDGASVRSLSPNSLYAWTLVQTGAERLPKTVYVRFSGGGVDEDKTVTDDIVLDTTVPTARATAVRSSTGRSYTLRATYGDRLSGVKSLQVTAKPGTRAVRTLSPRKARRLKNLKGVRYIRAVDRAGNRSAWRKITVR